MGPLLRWTEKQAEPVTYDIIDRAQKSDLELAKMTNNPEVLAHHLWGFLNLNLQDDAWEVFDSVEVGNGLGVWGLANLDTLQTTVGELMDMGDHVQNQRRIHKLAEIFKGIVAWENSHKEYQ